MTDGPGPGTEPAAATEGTGSTGAATDSGAVGAAFAGAAGSNGVPNHGMALELEAPAASVPRPARAVLQALAPQRYRVQFTIGQETHDAVKQLQALMRRELPDGDLATIFDQGVRLLLEKVEKAKFGVGAKRRPGAVKASGAGRAYETRIRFKTDNKVGTDGNVATDQKVTDGGERGKQRTASSRHVPNAVKRAVWWRDRGQCAFVSAAGHRCTERAFLELHHIHPYALDGPTTVGNISLRCRRHNAYEAELVFGPRGAPAVSKAP
jgi:hypothetical protein